MFKNFRYTQSCVGDVTYDRLKTVKQLRSFETCSQWNSKQVLVIELE
jgi:hypothetical protein